MVELLVERYADVFNRIGQESLLSQIEEFQRNAMKIARSSGIRAESKEENRAIYGLSSRMLEKLRDIITQHSPMADLTALTINFDYISLINDFAVDRELLYMHQSSLFSQN